MLESELESLHQGNIGIGVLQETKLTEGIHTHYSAGYKVLAIEADSRHIGGIAIAWQEEE